LLRAGGWTVPRDWTELVRAFAGAPDSDLSDASASRIASENTDGVVYSSWFWLQTPSKGKSEGAHFELGLAFALGKNMIVSGPRSCIFQALPQVRRFDDHDNALRHLLAIGQ
jgi:hypothetical protein